MSRYIKADEVLEQIRNKLGIKSLDYLLEAERQIVDVIQSAPSIDICFCRECVKHNTHRCHMAFDLIATEGNDFCSYGERRADDEV